MSNINWDFVEKCIVINLPERTDRLEKIKSELIRIKFPEDKIIIMEACFNENGALGCSLSHLAAVKMAKNEGWKNVLILEDDTIFNSLSEICQPINDLFHSLSTRNWDAALLSGQYYKIKKVNDEPETSPFLFRCYFAYGANSYIINHTVYQSLIYAYEASVTKLKEGKRREIYTLDSLWMLLMHENSWYCLYPCVAYQGAGFSNIENTYLNRYESFRVSKEKLASYDSTFD